MSRNFKLVLLCIQWGVSANLVANPLKAPEATVLAEARNIVTEMKNQARGPYRQLRWFCKDGSVLPPTPYACKELGGGHQYADYSDKRKRLAHLGWPVGTIYTALSWEEFWDAANRHQRMRELPLEQYMMDIDDGWILQQAKNYRGRIQVEDEEVAGRALLLKLLANTEWLSQNYLLARELVRVVPHGTYSDLARDIRRSAQEIAELVPSFEQRRIEIHTAPSEKSATRVRKWIDKNTALQPDIAARAQELARQLDDMYGASGRQLRMANLVEAFNKDVALQRFAPLAGVSSDESPLQSTARLSQLMGGIRQSLPDIPKAASRLLLLDRLNDIEAELRLQSSALLDNVSLSRRHWIRCANHLSYAAFGSGFVSTGEYQAVATALDAALAQTDISPQDYLALARKLNRIGNWALATVRYTFAEPLVKYTALDQRAGLFVDDLLRGSVTLQLAEATRKLGFDAEHAAGLNKVLFELPAPAMMALNPGLAAGKLRILTEQDLHQEVELQRQDIVVLPQTVSELAPVAGVLTMGEGNMLSHVQMLARNFGIPNVTITPALIERITSHADKSVVLAVGSDGSIVLQAESQLTGAQRQLLNRTNSQQREKLIVPPVDLSIRTPLPLADIDKSLSGVTVGPKAGNLGELNKLFPGRVAAAIAIPFGVFAEQVNSSTETSWQQLDTLYHQFNRGEISQKTLDKRLEALRQRLLSMPISDRLREQLKSLMQSEFGAAGSYGVFIRSDTNVEDLPGFTGAGLYETIANVVGLEQQLAALPRVWASILGPRAIAWRSNLLQNPEYVFPSVLLMKSMPVEKSGVLVTSDLATRGIGLTASTAWGVGGAVAGETSETLLLTPDGQSQLISEAKAPYQRLLPATGGVSWQPAPSGPVLTLPEQLQLRELAIEVAKKYQTVYDLQGRALPWDIEFGFINGQLTLFQIRPLIEHGSAGADHFLQTVRRANDTVNLETAMLGKIDLDIPPQLP